MTKTKKKPKSGSSPSAGRPRDRSKKNKRPGVVRRRIAFGLILIAIVGGLLTFDRVRGGSYGIGALVALVLTLGVREVYRMLSAIQPVPGKAVATLAAIAVPALQVASRGADWRRFVPDADFLVLIGFLLLILALGLRHRPNRNRLVGIALAVFGTLYVVGLGAFALRVRHLSDAVPGRLLFRLPDVGFWLLLFAIVIAKGTDICAFFVGRTFGKMKLIPWISPGKTVAGGVGALVGGILISGAFLLWTPMGRLFTLWMAVPLGILLATVTMVGDLIESLMKRSAAVKDSGALIPEFGGVLDIVDSVIVVLPVVYLLSITQLLRLQ